MDSDQDSTPLSSPPASSSPLPSSPLSVLSNSPSLPSSPVLFDAAKRYPSPSSSAAQSGSASPMKPSPDPGLREIGEICVRTDGPPPAKRRKVAGPRLPRTRTTEYLDLEKANDNGYQEELFTRLLGVLRKKKRIVVIAGAGISVSAGIPDFRSSTGLFTTLRGQHKLKSSGKHLFDASVYRDDSSTCSFHSMVRELAEITEKATPTPFHQMLASLAHEGRLMRLYTQNVDCIDTGMAPLATNVPLNTKAPWPCTIQLHGGLAHMVCSKCGDIEPFDAARFDGPEAPLCTRCHELEVVRTSFAGKRSHGVGRLRPRIVLYNEYNPDDEAIGMVTKADLRRVPDAVIVVGTSLKIPGVRRIVKEMCQVTHTRRDGFTAWLNIDPEPQGAEFKDCWDMVVRGKCDDVAELANLPRWDQQVDDERRAQGARSWEVTPDAEEAKEKNHLKNPVVRIASPESMGNAGTLPSTPAKPSKQPTKPRLAEQAVHDGIPTPVASPRPESVPPIKGSTPSGGKKKKQSKLLFATAAAATADEAKNTKKAPVSRKAAGGSGSTAKSGKTRQSTATAGGSSKRKPAKTTETELTKTFRTAKRHAVPAAQAALIKKEVLCSTGQSAARISPDASVAEDNDKQPSLPSLRPSSASIASTPLKRKLDGADITIDISCINANSHKGHENEPLSSSPLSILCKTPPPHPERRLSLDTISPTSKPRSMGHLID